MAAIPQKGDTQFDENLRRLFFLVVGFMIGWWAVQFTVNIAPISDTNARLNYWLSMTQNGRNACQAHPSMKNALQI